MTKILSWFFCAVAIATTVLLLGIFAWQSIPIWQKEGWGYFTGQRWYYRNHEFGTLSMIYGTVVVAVISLGLAAPIGFGAALCTSEYLPRRMRMAVKILVELLAGVPSVVYGLLGILLLRNWIYDGFESFELLSGDTLLTAGILLAVMILPTIVTLSDDALRGVPAAQRRAAQSLGMTRAETILFVTLPQAKQGLGAALLLSLGRALGEMIAVFLVVGRQDNHLPDHWYSLRAWLDAGQTLASKLGGSETNIAYGDAVHWGAMMGLGLLLLTMTTTVTLIATTLMRKSDAQTH